MKATYKDVKADIFSKITKGEWGPGSLIPNEIDLAEIYGCARATREPVRCANLLMTGSLSVVVRAGTRVRASPIRQARFGIPLVRSEIEERGAAYRYSPLQNVA